MEPEDIEKDAESEGDGHEVEEGTNESSSETEQSMDNNNQKSEVE